MKEKEKKKIETKGAREFCGHASLCPAVICKQFTGGRSDNGEVRGKFKDRVLENRGN